jgi:hypothetical protein
MLNRPTPPQKTALCLIDRSLIDEYLTQSSVRQLLLGPWYIERSHPTRLAPIKEIKMS